MPVDYAEPSRRTPGNKRRRPAGGQRKATPRRREGPKVSVGFAYLSGLTSGLAVAALIWLLPKFDMPVFGEAGDWLAAPGVSEPESKPEAATTLEDLRFYEELPNRKVWVPVVEAYQPQGAQAADGHPQFLLQAGSFRDREDAERLRARLLLLGLDARVRRVELSAGVPWHRVLVGPFDEASSMRKALTRLRKAQIDAIPLRQG